MRAVLAFCFVLSVVSSLPVRTEEELDLPRPEIPVLLAEFPEDGIVKEHPVLPELQGVPELFDEDVVVHPDLPVLPVISRLPKDLASLIAENLSLREFLVVPELPEGDIQGIEPELPIQPEMPTIPELPEDIEDDTNIPIPLPEEIVEEGESVPPGSPDDLPIMIHDKGNNVSMRNQIRPGMQVSNYIVVLEPSVGSGTFSGHLTATVIVNDAATLEDEIVFYARDLNIQSVTFSISGGSSVHTASFDVDDDDGLLKIETGFEISMYTFFIEYTGSLRNFGSGLWAGDFDNNNNYLAMNLHATNARRVFPCMDELTAPSTISFTFNNIEYNNIFMNSVLEDNTVSQFKALQGPALRWGMVAHNFRSINIPTTGVQLYARDGTLSQEIQASVAINVYFNTLETWIGKPYNEIVLDQDGRMMVIAIPDVHKEWYALSTVCIWEPYVLMELTHSVKQRKEALNEIAEAISRQWFGYVIYPQNWRYQWVTHGLASYTAYELNREFQTSQLQDITLLDFNTIFVTDVIQEALYRDAYEVARPLEPAGDIFDEDEIRDHLKGLGIVKYKAPAIMRMLRLTLENDNQDFVLLAGQTLLNSWALETIFSRFFVDAVNARWLSDGNGMVDDLAEFLEPWTRINGYPILHVGLRQGGVLLTQEKFGYSATDQVNFEIPITWTTSIAPNYDDTNIRPTAILDTNTMTINMALDDEDYVLFNIQGQGYYRVNYDLALWERIIWALEDPDSREQIHPLNRATLIDDVLNLARASVVDYDVAFQVVLTMEHEIDYAPWKAFVRNMDFLRKRLVAYVDDDDDLDQEIYMRMVRRTVGRVEREIGFYPDPQLSEDSSVSLTRGLVMDHACRAGYRPCIAAAVDWFWDPNDRDVVNPGIPHEIRPAVYCTMAREGGNDIISALYDRLEIEPTMYERVVILESLACSQDSSFILTFLQETLAANGPYGVEERNRIFKAVVESSYANAFTAVSFLSTRTADVRRMYGGAEKLEELIWHLAENMADADLSSEFQTWANSIISNLDDSEMAAQRARLLIQENLRWNNARLDAVYEWIDDNGAPTMAVSLLLILGSFLLTILNR